MAIVNTFLKLLTRKARKLIDVLYGPQTIRNSKKPFLRSKINVAKKIVCVITVKILARPSCLSASVGRADHFYDRSRTSNQFALRIYRFL